MGEEIAEAEISQFKFYEVLHRYRHYLETIPTAYLAPFSSLWTENILRLVEESLGNLQLAAELMKEMWQEVLQDYHGALRKVVAEHALSDQLRQRTGVLFVPNPVPLWGTQPFTGIEGTAGGLPEAWPVFCVHSISFVFHFAPKRLAFFNHLMQHDQGGLGEHCQCVEGCKCACSL